MCSGSQSLLSRGLQLEAQLVTEGQDLQALLEKLQENSTLPFLSVHALQGRMKHTAKKSKVTTEYSCQSKQITSSVMVPTNYICPVC